MTRGLFSADPRVKPADLACGFVYQAYSGPPEGPCRAGASRIGPADPTRGSENDTKLAASCMKVSLVPILRSYVIIYIASNQPDSNFSYQG